MYDTSIIKEIYSTNKYINTINNMSSEPIPAMNAIENHQEQIRRYQKEQSRLINNAPDEAFDEIAKEMVDEAPVTPPEGRFQDALLGDIVKANEALGTPTPPKEDLAVFKLSPSVQLDPSHVSVSFE